MFFTLKSWVNTFDFKISLVAPSTKKNYFAEQIFNIFSLLTMFFHLFLYDRMIKSVIHL